MNETPQTVTEYLDALRAAFGSADPALVQDALYDAEEYLRAELANRPGVDEATVLREIVGSYGAPAEVAAAYAQTELTVQRALKTPTPAPRRTAFGRFLGVFADARAYTALFYMLLALPTGIFFFTWTVTGSALSLSLMILIIGLPFLLLFLGSMRLLSLVEGRIVETLLGVRMPRRPVYAGPRPFAQRMREMVTDPRTWSTLLYMVIRLPLGVLYFTLAVIGIILPLALIVAPLALLFAPSFPVGDEPTVMLWDGSRHSGAWSVFLIPLGVLGAALNLHLARGVAALHGALAKHLLVAS